MPYVLSRTHLLFAIYVILLTHTLYTHSRYQATCGSVWAKVPTASRATAQKKTTKNPPKICEIPIIRQDQVYYGFLFPKTKYVYMCLERAGSRNRKKKNSVPFSCTTEKTYILMLVNRINNRGTSKGKMFILKKKTLSSKYILSSLKPSFGLSPLTFYTMRSRGAHTHKQLPVKREYKNPLTLSQQPIHTYTYREPYQSWLVHWVFFLLSLFLSHSTSF
jgi:hypothetical protein